MEDKIQKNTILLNADYTILNFISLKRTMTLYLSNKIEIEKTYDNIKIHPKLEFGFPSIVRMKEYINIPYNKRRVSPKKKKIFIRDNYECQFCNKKINRENGTIDHVIPKSHSKYPGHIWTNVVTCCHSCNNRKGSKTPEEAGMKLKKQPFAPNFNDLLLLDNLNLIEEIEDFKRNKWQ
jgi:5-methylcytosine-specific restriction endonuclease McrA